MLGKLRMIFRPSVICAVALLAAGAFFGYMLGHAVGAESSDAGQTFTVAQFGARPDAPELVGGVAWLNTDNPVKIADLRGRIVVLDFWTLCCINCIHTLPDLAKIEARYPGVVVVIGVHSPKFENEKKTESIQKAIMRYEVKHPVVNDADHKIWNAYGVKSWPTLGLIDPNGKVVRGFSGEGNYKDLEAEIEKLLKEFKGKLKNEPIAFKLAKEKEATPLYFPGKVLADAASGRLFIADSTDHRVVVTTLEGKKIAVIGSGKEGFKDGNFATAQFSDTQGMALDGDTLFVADRKNHSIRAINLKDETVKTVAGTGEQNGTFEARTRGGLGVATGLNSPWDLLLVKGKGIDGEFKKVYIAMAGHHQIWTYDVLKKRVDPYAGNGREEITDGTLKGSGFAQPSGLATDGKRLFVADSESSAIRSVPLPGAKGNVTTVVGVPAGNNLFNFGDKNGTGQEVRLQHALGVAYDEGKLYVADTYNSKIKIIDPVKRHCETYLGDPPGWLKDKMFNEPGGLSIAAGKMYIADTNNHRIQVVDMKTKQISTLRLEGVDPVRREEAVSKEKK